MATFTSTAGARLVKKDSTTSADTYVVLDNSKGLVLTGNANGDTIKIDGLSTDFTFKASGKTLTLTSVDDSSFRIQVQIANGGSVVLGFLDGGVTASYASAGSAKGVTLSGASGTQKLTSKAAALADAVSVNEATASVDTFDTTTGGTTTTTTSGVNVTLTTNVETSSGTESNDVFSATLTNTGASLNDGDQINGGSGTDTLSLIAQGANAVSFLNGVENIDVRLLSAQTLEAVGWSGVTDVTVVNTSIDDKTLTVNNAAQSTRFKISDDANIVISYLDSSGSGDVARLAVDGGGVSGSAATFTIAGTEAVTLGASGTSFVTVSASDTALKDITISGVGTLDFSIAETSISGISLAQFSGTSTVTIGAASNVNITGGTGADTFKFGSTFNADTVNGGAGTDTLLAGLDGIVNLGRVTNVEVGTFSATGGFEADASGAAFATINLVDIDAAADVRFNDLGATTINLSDRGSASDLTFGFGGGNVTVNLAATGAAAASSMAVNNASGVSIVNLGASGQQKFDQLTVGASGKTVSINTGSGTTVASAMTLSGAGSLTVSVAGSGTFTNTSTVASSLASVTLSAVGQSANATVGALSLNTGAVTVNAVATGGNASASFGNVTVGASGSIALSTTATGSGASLTGGTVGFGTGTSTLNLSAQGASALASVGAITAGAASGNTTLTLTASGAAASAAVGTVAIGSTSVSTITLNLAGDSNVSVGAITGASAESTVAIAVRAAASADATFGALNLASADAASASTVRFDFTMGSGDLTFTTVRALDVLAVSGTLGNNATATFTSFSADEVRSITLAGSGSLQMGDVYTNSGVGAISVTDGLFSANIAATSIGALSVAGDGFTLVGSTDVSIGAISVGAGNSGDVNISNSLSATFGTINILGGGSAAVSVGNASGVGLVSTVGHSGHATLNFGSALSGGERVRGTLGVGSNDVFVSLAGNGADSRNGDIYTLTSGSGIDRFFFQTTANNDARFVNFQLASGVDKLYFATAGFDLKQASATSTLPAAGALGVLQVSADAQSLGSAQSVIVLQSAQFSDASAVAAALQTAGAFTVNVGGVTSTTAGLEFIVVWEDTAGDTHVSVATTVASAAAGAVLFSAITASDIKDLVLLDDVSIRSFSGNTFTDTFFAY
jgi:hypothetical protein